MKLINRESKEEFDAEISEIGRTEIALISKSNRFDFDWIKESDFTVYKITVNNNDKALGLMSLIDLKEELRIHINLIENANENKGQHKQIDRVAGCLIAFAVRIAFDKGYLGFTSLIPKTELIDLYIKKYGFQQFGRQLALNGTKAITIINKYL